MSCFTSAKQLPVIPQIGDSLKNSLENLNVNQFSLRGLSSWDLNTQCTQGILSPVFSKAASLSEHSRVCSVNARPGSLFSESSTLRQDVHFCECCALLNDGNNELRLSSSCLWPEKNIASIFANANPKGLILFTESKFLHVLSSTLLYLCLEKGLGDIPFLLCIKSDSLSFQKVHLTIYFFYYFQNTFKSFTKMQSFFYSIISFSSWQV